MTDQEYYDTVEKLLMQSIKAAKSKKYVPGKADFIKGVQALIDKTQELRGKQ